ncbi:uncharacterized protein LOC133290574 [Gastrolobium bilobum]|uniref:uncharacterized protein LOC133290574 n=1 Tax=Gastrolobium bilobum TaxID=150636 RepID=UPI002AB1CBEF|nr:uncharacterized protein LOC133290574 [Gastrolobium bilobum]
MIIDGGSCENVVYNTMVEKLGLKTEEHPQPYKLSWLKKESEVKVNNKCLVQFSIGKKYTDEAWYDVIPMDACHILLGRPWQFDRKMRHNGFKNTYTFKKDGLTITLGPSDLRNEAKNTMLSRADFQEEVANAVEVLACVVMEENCSVSDIPLQVKPLLEDFADVVLKEMPPGLPPMRDIQHVLILCWELLFPTKQHIG